ncbi:MAG TPA: NAD(P)H:quinone oxidoreductase [Kiritimatiellia bacterium]|jgi:NAD(P)H dehydrogenase (quinone)|nr:NAD(P)H:quinone oxidoreductase [Kiritimatiellia bacterium]
MNVQVIFYSMYGHVWQMAEAVAEGAGEVQGAKVSLWQVEELVSEESLAASGALEARAQFAHIPVARVAQLEEADVILFGAPTRYGMMAAQMKQFIDQTGGLWARGVLVGKLGGVFGSTNSQHCGHEATLLSFHTVLFGLGMVVVGVPPTAPGLHVGDAISGGTPYGATTIAGSDGSRQPSSIELETARLQGRHAATIGMRLFAR